MDQFREPYLQMPNDYTGKMPFYLTYPMPNVYQTEKEYERDMERMKELYPRRMKELLAYVEEECDKMEYEGSMMYDEYPDREFLYRELLKVRERHPEETMGGTEEQDLLQVLFVNEIYRRRIYIEGRKRGSGSLF